MTTDIIWRTDLNVNDPEVHLPWRDLGGFFCPDHPDGASQWDRDPQTQAIVGIIYVCPCGCKDWRSIPVHFTEGRGWKWDGNEVSPTLTPSIFHVKSSNSANCGWHGFLTAGMWVTV